MDTTYNDSKITINNEDFIVPDWIMDDVSYFYPEIYSQIKKTSKEYTYFSSEYYPHFCQLRKQIYWMCNWYTELIDENVPVIKSKIIPMKAAEGSLNTEISLETETSSIFVRLCNASPKDIINPIFHHESFEYILDILKESSRTGYMFDLKLKDCPHLVIREVASISYEMRCFWYKNKLRAVSGPLEYVNISTQNKLTTKVNKFFENYADCIFYNSATIDLGIVNNDVVIIEINSFGSDMLASGQLFTWSNDFTILYNSKTPVYRFKKEFEW